LSIQLDQPDFTTELRNDRPPILVDYTIKRRAIMRYFGMIGMAALLLPAAAIAQSTGGTAGSGGQTSAPDGPTMGTQAPPGSTMGQSGTPGGTQTSPTAQPESAAPPGTSMTTTDELNRPDSTSSTMPQREKRSSTRRPGTTTGTANDSDMRDPTSTDPQSTNPPR